MVSNQKVLQEINARVAKYYDARISEFSETPKGVDWPDVGGQRLRFQQLLKVVGEREGDFSILDYGCGYGALVDFLEERQTAFRYVGIDFSNQQISAARRRHAPLTHCKFIVEDVAIEPLQYAVASGTMNVKLDVPKSDWHDYVLHQIHRLDKLSTKGFAFNCLTRFSDPGRMREDLFYGDPSFYFNYCSERFSRSVAVLADYGLYEFTVIVRK